MRCSLCESYIVHVDNGIDAELWYEDAANNLLVLCDGKIVSQPV